MLFFSLYVCQKLCMIAAFGLQRMNNLHVNVINNNNYYLKKEIMVSKKLKR